MSDPEIEPAAPPIIVDVLDNVGVGEIFKHSRERLVRFAGRVGFETYAEDAVQEAAVGMIRRVSNTNLRPLDANSTYNYLRTAVRGKVIDAHRERQARGGTHELIEVSDTRLPPTPDFSDEAIANVELLERIREVLSPAHARIIELNIVQQYTVPEIAKKLNIPLGTAKSRISYALRALRQAAKDGVFDGYDS